MSSRSATVLVIFIVAIIAFCLACVCASITGPISILPNESNSGGILDNLSAITDDNVSYDNQYSDDYSYSSSSDSYSGSNVETTTDSSSGGSGGEESSDSSSTYDSNVETTIEQSNSYVETTTSD